MPEYRDVQLVSDYGDASGIDFEAVKLFSYDADYLIITPDSLYASAMNLFKYRQAKGYNVSIITLSQIAPTSITAEEIDAWIEAYTANNSSLKFVVLIGDYSLIPGFEYVDGEEPFYSDLKYFIDNEVYETDYVTDIAYGRIPATSDEQLNFYISKMEQFELTFPNRNTVAAFYYDEAHGMYTDRIFQEAENNGYDTFDIGVLGSNEQNELFTLLNQNSSDIAMLFYYGHGLSDRNGPLLASALDLWTNYEYPVLYFSGACEFNSYLAGNGSPLGYQLIFADGGSVASIGPAVNGGFGYAYYLADIFVGMSKSNNTVGEMFMNSMQAYYNYIVNLNQDVSPDSTAYLFFRRMKLIGDPGLLLK